MDRASGGLLTLLLAAALLMSVLWWATARAPQEPMPDILLVTLDSVRADRLAGGDYPREVMPTLDELASDAMVFEQHLVPLAQTLPAHVSLMTSTWPVEHSIRSNSLPHRRRTHRDGFLRMAQYLDDRGYQTGGFVSAASLGTGSSMALGFDEYDAPEKPKRAGDRTTYAALKWVEASAEDVPLFLWVHLFDAHAPYKPDNELDTYELDAQLDAWMIERDIGGDSTRPHFGSLINKYDAEVRFVDHQLARLLEVMRRRPAADDMVVVVVGTSGQGLMQHHDLEAEAVWAEHLHTPWVLQTPGLRTGTHSRVVSLIDVWPTVLAEIDLPQEDLFLNQVAGRDVLSDRDRTRAIFSVTSDRRASTDPLEYAITTEDWKLIWSEEETRLYDREADPFELSDVARSYEAEATALREDGEAMLAEMEVRRAAWWRPVVEPVEEP